MIELYTWSTPNGRKASVMLEECAIDYSVHPVDISNGKQFEADFLKFSPNNRIPAIIDTDENASVFESGAILVYLAEKAGQFLPTQKASRAEVLAWTFWQIAHLGPALGQLNYFMNTLEEKSEIAINRFHEESLRVLKILEGQLSEHDFIAGEYSIADIANYPWAAVAVPLLKDQAGGLEATQKWLAAVAARPAVKRGMAVPTDAEKAAVQKMDV